MKVLIISRTKWDSSNSFGNSYTNLFSGIDNIEIANLYLESGAPNTDVCSRFFQITFKGLLKNLINRNVKTGKEVYTGKESSGVQLKNKEKNLFDFFKKYKLTFYYWVRELVWKIGRWKTPELNEFLDSFDPDIIFQPVYYSRYINRIALYCKNYCNIKMLGYVSDDVYTLRQFNLSPFYWIDRLIIRQAPKKLIKHCEILYTISDIQKEEYEKIFGVPCKVLTKSYSFDNGSFIDTVVNTPITFVYAGNIGDDRWRSLGLLVSAIDKINKTKDTFRLKIYTSTPMTKKIRSKLTGVGTSIYSAIPYSELLIEQNNADVLVHVEGLSLKSRCLVHQSFSTKLVDYFYLKKCIFSIGVDDEASINYLRKKDASIISSSYTDVENNLNMIAENPDIINQYAEKAYLCGYNNHSSCNMKEMVYQDIETFSK